MNKNSGFVLVEAIASVVIVSVCLTLIAQSLLTNFRTGVRFQESTRALLAMENTMGLLYKTNNSSSQISTSPQPLEEPYEKLDMQAQMDPINDHLKKAQLILNWPTLKRQSNSDVTTIIYIPDAGKTHSF